MILHFSHMGLTDGLTFILFNLHLRTMSLLTSPCDPAAGQVTYGNEDKDASRRVVFKFRLTDEQMIEQLKQILERNDTGPAAGIDAVIEAAE